MNKPFSNWKTVPEVVDEQLLRNAEGDAPSAATVLLWANKGHFKMLDGSPGAVKRGRQWFISTEAIQLFVPPKMGRPPKGGKQ